MNKKLLLLFLLIPIWAYSQDIEVKRFELLDKDHTAVMSPRKDLNGIMCGLVKVALKEPGAEFEGNVMGDVQFTGKEYLVYLPNGTKRLGIKHPDYLPTTIVFSDYGTKRVASSTTYELKVKTNKKKAKVDNSKKGIAVFNIKPSNAMLMIDDQIADGSGGAYTLSLPYGTHYYTIKLKDFALTNQMVKIDKNAKTIDVDLTEFFAKVDISCKTADAEIIVNGEQKGLGNWNGYILPGKCTIEARKEGCHLLSKTIELMDGEKSTVGFEEMKPITGILRVENDLKNCEVYLNGKKVGTTPWVNRELPIGEYKVEIRKNYYKPFIQTLKINEGQEMLINEELTPTQFGRLNIKAEQGNSRAKRAMADLYKYGIDNIEENGLTKNDEGTAFYVGEDGEGDDTWLVTISDLKREGVSIKKDMSKEIYWAKMALNNYDEDFDTKMWLTNESYHLMECYLTGNGIEQDFTQSFFWAKIAARDNWWQSNAWVAWHYYYGRGVSKDVNSALQWLNKEGNKYNACNGQVLKSAIINNQAEWMDKDILYLLNKD